MLYLFLSRIYILLILMSFILSYSYLNIMLSRARRVVCLLINSYLFRCCYVGYFDRARIQIQGEGPNLGPFQLLLAYDSSLAAHPQTGLKTWSLAARFPSHFKA